MNDDGYASDDDQSFKSVDSSEDDFHEPHEVSPPPNSTHEPQRAYSENARGRTATKTATPPSTDSRFPAEEEAALLSESNTLKTSANTQFGRGAYSEAIQTYDRALASCPNYLDYEIAVLQSNIAACHIKLADWKEAIDSATKSLDALERLDPLPKAKKASANNGGLEGKTGGGAAAGVVEEVDDQTAERIEALAKSGRTRDEVQKIRIKAMMRRGKARAESGGWAALQGADEDYGYLASLPELSPLDRKTVQRALVELRPRLENAKEKEMAEMMGKLKGLGNSLLKPFGLNTNNFQFVKDENSGGYSMNFNQGK